MCVGLQSTVLWVLQREYWPILGEIKSFRSVQIKPDQTVQGEEGNLDSAEVGSEGSLDSAGSGNCGPNSTESEPWLEARSHC